MNIFNSAYENYFSNENEENNKKNLNFREINQSLGKIIENYFSQLSKRSDILGNSLSEKFFNLQQQCALFTNVTEIKYIYICNQVYKNIATFPCF